MFADEIHGDASQDTPVEGGTEVSANGADSEKQISLKDGEANLDDMKNDVPGTCSQFEFRS